MPEQNKSYVVDAEAKQKPSCWCRNKTKAILLMPEQNKSHIVDGKKQKPFVMVSKKGSDEFSRRLDPFKKNFCHQNFLLETSPIIESQFLLLLSWVELPQIVGFVKIGFSCCNTRICQVTLRQSSVI